MKNKLFVFVLTGLIMVNLTGRAADTLRVGDAIVEALDHNFGITLAENNKRIAEEGNSIGAAGMLPKLDLSATRSLSVNNMRQEYYDGRIREGDNAKTNNRNAGLQMTWTLFDGFNMFIQKARLSELETLSDIQLRSVVENIVTQVTNTYYEIVAQEALKKVYEEAVKVSMARKEFTKARFGLGSDSELSLLQATVDLNADSANLIRQISLISNLKADLNFLLCRETTTPFEVTKDIPINKSLAISDLTDRSSRENPDLKMARNAITLASLAVKEAKSVQMPRLTLNSGYSYSLSNSDVGLMISNKNYGYTVGVSLAYNIFNGFTTRQRISTARIREESAQTELKNTELEIDVHLKQVYNDYLTNLRLVDFEMTSLGFAKHSFKIAEEKYRLGSLNDIEFRETQAKMLEAENRLLSALYRSKLAETELLRISGQLSGNAF